MTAKLKLITLKRQTHKQMNKQGALGFLVFVRRIHDVQTRFAVEVFPGFDDLKFFLEALKRTR